jgi:uncharacterized phage protein (TIGR02218 family)
MKSADAATLATLATGQALRLDLYAIMLAGGAGSFYFTSHQVPVINGGNIYQTGIVFARGPHKQAAGLAVQSLKLTMTPQADNAAGPVFVSGFPFLTACAQRIFDGARVLWSKMFLDSYDDTSRAAVPWKQGRVNKTDVGRFSADLTINDDIEMLNVSAPINVFQPGCTHTLFDTGCALQASAFTVAGAVIGSASTVLTVNTNLTQAGVWFRLGRISFTSGQNAGVVRFVKDYGAGVFTLARPLPFAPAAGDLFTALPGCPKTVAACSNTNAAVGPPFNNLKHNKSEPFIPVPETLYDGGTSSVSIPSLGGQGGAKVGSPFSSGAGQRGIFQA